MADYQRVVEFLRDIRMNPIQNVTDELRQYAAEYAELCAQANERLRQCSTFLQQGLRSEAIHLADESPNLLDLVAALDLPEPQAWAEFCQNNDLPVPPPLQMERASQLNEAYAADQPLDHLLQRHRLLALARGPIRERLEIMRQLAAQDPGSAFWEKDIRTFERVRLRELPTSFYAAVKSRNMDAINAIAAEIDQNAWYEPVPDDLRTAVSEALQRMQRAVLEEHLQKLVNPLHEAFAARNQVQCAALVKRWRDLMTAAGIAGVSAELTAEVQPVAAWLQQEAEIQTRQKAYAAACQEFTDALNGDLPDAQLAAAYEKLRRFEEGVPAELAGRYEEKQEERRIARRHATRAKLAVAGAVLVLLLIGGAVIAIGHMQSEAARGWARQIERAVAERDPQRAQAAIAEQEAKAPKLNNEPGILAAKEHARKLQDEWKTLAEECAGLKKRFIKIRDSVAPVANDAAAAPDALLAAVIELNEGLRAGLTSDGDPIDYSWVDGEKEYLNLRSELVGLQGRLRTRAGKAVATQADELAQALPAIPKDTTPAGLSEGLRQLDAMQAKAGEMQRLTGLDDATTKQVADLLAAIEKRRAFIQVNNQLGQEFATLGMTVTNADDLEKALRAFVKKYPDGPRAADFTKAADVAAIGKSVEAWRDLVASWSQKFVPASAQVAKERSEAVDAYINAYSNSPLIPVAKTYLEYLKQTADILSEPGAWQNAYADLLANPLVAELAYMEISDGSRYFVVGNIKYTEGRINDRKTISFESVDGKNPARRLVTTIEPPRRVVNPNNEPILTPHAKFAQGIADELKQIDERTADAWGIMLTDRLLKADDVDIVVKSLMILQSLKTTQIIDGWAIGEVYDKVIRDLTRQNLENLNWYDRERPVPEATVLALRKILGSIPKSTEVLPLLAARKAQLFKSVAIDYAGMGLLLRDDADKPFLRTRITSNPGYVAWAIGPAASADSPLPTLVPIAQFKDGAYVINEQAARGLPQGTLVFFCKP